MMVKCNRLQKLAGMTWMMKTEQPATDLCALVEKDVQKRKHLKDPFKENYIRLVAAPFHEYFHESNIVKDPNAKSQQQQKISEPNGSISATALRHGNC